MIVDWREGPAVQESETANGAKGGSAGEVAFLALRGESGCEWTFVAARRRLPGMPPKKTEATQHRWVTRAQLPSGLLLRLWFGRDAQLDAAEECAAGNLTERWPTAGLHAFGVPQRNLFQTGIGHLKDAEGEAAPGTDAVHQRTTAPCITLHLDGRPFRRKHFSGLDGEDEMLPSRDPTAV